MNPRLLSKSAEEHTSRTASWEHRWFPLIFLGGPFSGFQHFLQMHTHFKGWDSDFALHIPLPPPSACVVNCSHLIVLNTLKTANLPVLRDRSGMLKTVTWGRHRPNLLLSSVACFHIARCSLMNSLPHIFCATAVGLIFVGGTSGYFPCSYIWGFKCNIGCYPHCQHLSFISAGTLFPDNPHDFCSLRCPGSRR